MAKVDNLPFAQGSTYFDGTTPGTTEAEGITLEGKVYWVEDIDFSTTGAKANRTGLMRKLMVVRNSSGITLLPKRLVKFKETAGTTYGGTVDGYVALGYGDITNPDFGFPVDEYLTNGCPANDLCYITVEGPALTITSLAALSAQIAVGDYIVHATAATSQATTAGRVQPSAVTAAFTGITDLREVQRQVGRAMSAKTTNNTDASLLVNIVRW